MKRYLLFACPEYEGFGWDDFRGAYKTIQQARDALDAIHEHHRDWWQIVDLVALKVVMDDSSQSDEID